MNLKMVVKVLGLRLVSWSSQLRTARHFDSFRHLSGAPQHCGEELPGQGSVSGVPRSNVGYVSRDCFYQIPVDIWPSGFSLLGYRPFRLKTWQTVPRPSSFEQYLTIYLEH